MIQDIRVGLGYDVHQLVTGRPLVIGGVTIPHTHGLDGHSDADVLLHAICDAMLGALALGDIGKHFPNTDVRFKGINSIELLRESNVKIQDRGFKVHNLDCMLIAEAPKINPWIPSMLEAISKTLDIEQERISIKATTSETMGFVGRKEGIAAHAVVLLVK